MLVSENLKNKIIESIAALNHPRVVTRDYDDFDKFLRGFDEGKAKEKLTEGEKADLDRCLDALKERTWADVWKTNAVSVDRDLLPKPLAMDLTSQLKLQFAPAPEFQGMSRPEADGPNNW